jgi:hypothetical protein
MRLAAPPALAPQHPAAPRRSLLIAQAQRHAQKLACPFSEQAALCVQQVIHCVPHAEAAARNNGPRGRWALTRWIALGYASCHSQRECGVCVLQEALFQGCPAARWPACCRQCACYAKTSLSMSGHSERPLAAHRGRRRRSLPGGSPRHRRCAAGAARRPRRQKSFARCAARRRPAPPHRCRRGPRRGGAAPSAARTRRHLRDPPRRCCLADHHSVCLSYRA